MPLLLLFLALAGKVHEPADPAQLAPIYLERMEQAIANAGGNANHPGVARAAFDAAAFLAAHGRQDEAAKLARRALEIDETALGPQHLTVAADLELVASMSPAEWLPLTERALAIRERNAPASPEAARLHSRLAAFYDARRAPKVALDHYRAAVEAYRKSPPPGDEVAYAVALNDLGLALEPESKFAESEQLYRRALAIQERRLGAQHPETAITLNNLAGTLGATGRLSAAEPLLRRALSILEKTLGPGHARTAACAHNLGDLFSATGRRNLAEPLYAKALAAFENLGDQAGAAEVRASMTRQAPAREQVK